MSAHGTDPQVSITMYPDGPLVVRGDVVVRDVDGTEVETNRVMALCRCGKSARKPFCDGNHKAARVSEARSGRLHTA